MGTTDDNGFIAARAAQLVGALTPQQQREVFEAAFSNTSFYISYPPAELPAHLQVLGERLAKAEGSTEVTLSTEPGNAQLYKALLATGKQYARDIEPLYRTI